MTTPSSLLGRGSPGVACTSNPLPRLHWRLWGSSGSTLRTTSSFPLRVPASKQADPHSDVGQRHGGRRSVRFLAQASRDQRAPRLTTHLTPVCDVFHVSLSVT